MSNTDSHQAVLSWLSNNKAHCEEYSDLETLVSVKRSKNLKISVVIPTLNEEKTIGRTVSILRENLVRSLGLIDEVLVLDSGSNDNTLEISRSEGARVYVSEELLAGATPYRGKGENLWKGIFCAEGDIIAFVDADIENFDAHFVYGLLGPLLLRDEIKFTKAFYRRPIVDKQNNTFTNDQGGRVTEIFIRPLLSQFFPKMTGFIQPLAGEYAARREVLESISHPVSYGVDIGILIDVVEKFSLESVVQVDLGTRVHRNRDTLYLGRMSYEILQILMHKAEKLGVEASEGNLVLNGLLQFSNGEINLHQANSFQQPPMTEVAEYLKKFSAGGVSKGDRLRYA